MGWRMLVPVWGLFWEQRGPGRRNQGGKFTDPDKPARAHFAALFLGRGAPLWSFFCFLFLFLWSTVKERGWQEEKTYCGRSKGMVAWSGA